MTQDDVNETLQRLAIQGLLTRGPCPCGGPQCSGRYGLSAEGLRALAGMLSTYAAALSRDGGDVGSALLVHAAAINVARRTIPRTPAGDPDQDPHSNLTVESGLTPDGQPTCMFTWGPLAGELTADETRDLAEHCRRAADGADLEAHLLAELTARGLPRDTAVDIIRNLRTRRREQT